MTAPLAAAFALVLLSAPLRAEEPPAAPDPIAEARRSYLDGIELIRKAQWADALVSFEQSARLRPNAGTTYNIGVCERAVGHYLRARDTLRRALSEDAASGNQLAADQRSDATAFLGEIEGVLVHLQVHLDPPQSEIAVDGRPLDALPREGERAVLVAGVLPPGRGQAPPAADFELILEPGQHLFVLARKGYSNVALQRRFEPGARAELPLMLAKLPATIRVSAMREGAAVAIDDVDVGVAPVELSRPAGSYRVVARKKGFVSYQTEVRVQAGEQVELQAPLPPERPIYKRWWLWTGAAALATVIVGLGLYFGLNQQPPPYDGGSANWVACQSGCR